MPPSSRQRLRRPDRALAVAALAAALAAPPALAQDPAEPAPAADPAAAQPLMTLRPGDTGQPVVELQRALAARGAELSADGEYGPMTEAAVRAVQDELGQEATGVADPTLLAALGLELREPALSPACVAPGAGDAPAGRRLRTFPLVGEYRYSASDFGAPRHQGAHEGVDILADRGTPVLAVADAVVKRLSRTESGLGGIWAWLRDGEGTEYYYAHLDSVAPGLAEGDRVATGQRIGSVGNTGDARYGATHLHFEVHPGGGRAVDPYPDLRAVDPGSGTRTLEGDGCSAPAAQGASVRLSVGQLRINQRIAQAAVRRVNRLSAAVRGRRPAARAGGDAGRIRLSRGQLLINQRISQAALVRARGVEARLDGRPPGAAPTRRGAGRVTLSRRQLLINQRVSQAALRTINDLRGRVAAGAAPG